MKIDRHQKNSKDNKTTIVISANSGIGKSIALSRLNKGCKVVGTYNQMNQSALELMQSIPLEKLDITDYMQVKSLKKIIKNKYNSWDELVICSGSLSPIQEFEFVDFKNWTESINCNFISQVRIIRELLELRSRNNPIVAVFAAGGGSTAKGFSAYNISKVALTKTMECLDDEIRDCRFCSIGPGWVNTEIHKATLDTCKESLDAYIETKRRIEENDFVQMETILLFFDWLISQPKEIIGGRNISIPHDKWRSEKFKDLLIKENQGGKLRRYLNYQLNGCD